MHSKQKGTLAEMKVTADLYKRGYSVAIPQCDLLPFDLIAIDKNLQMIKVQVKYCKLNKGIAKLELRNSMSNKSLQYKKHYNQKEVDIFALYVNDEDECLYINSDILKTHKTCFNITYGSPIKGGPKRNYREKFLGL